MSSGKMAIRVVAIVMIGGLLVAPAIAANWPQFGFDAAHSGVADNQGGINAGNVATLRMLFQVKLPDDSDGAPAYQPSVATSNGSRDLLFVTTKAGRIIALDARSGQQIWMQQPATGPRYTTSSPALDPDGQFVYSYGLDGYVHKYQVGDGVEVKGGGWPELATRKPEVEKGSSALAVATAKNGTSYLYVANGGYPGDAGDYQGHITAINLASGAQNVFNATCSEKTIHFVANGTAGADDCSHVQTAAWARPGVIYDAHSDRIYFTTGNGDFGGSGGHEWGDSILALNADGTGTNGQPLDSYTPQDYQQLQDSDADLGSADPALVAAPAGSKYTHLAVQAGKDAKLRLVNLDSMSGQGGVGHTGGELELVGVPQGGGVLTQPATWTNPADGTSWLFVTNGRGAAGLKLTAEAGNPHLTTAWQNDRDGTSPIIVGGLLFYASSGNIYALDPTSGKLLWSDQSIGSIHWASPIVAGGALYIADGNAQLTAYTPGGVAPATPAATPLPDTPDRHYFAATGQTVSGRFLHYWEDNGGLASYGYPISGELNEKSELDAKTYTVQYFERAVFELHPENQPPYDVLLSQLGTLRLRQKYGAPGPIAPTILPPNALFFAQTRHNLGGVFRSYWEQHGVLARFGYPISEQFAEKSELNGQTYTVQYFERAVMEYHPENQPPYNVLLSQLGTFQYRQKH